MRDYKNWTNSQARVLEMGILPSGRTIISCKRFCENNKKKFPGFKTIKNNMRLLQKCKETK